MSEPSPEIAAWYVDLDAQAGALDRFRGWLSDDELARAERFRSDRDRSRYMAGRAALRYVLARQLGCFPADLRFTYGRNGKPMLEGGRGQVEFNLAHSGADAIIALGHRVAIGVDIERHGPIADVESLAKLVFSEAERRELDRAPDPASAFLNGWTRKEAYVKALGLGLTAPLTKITVSLTGRAALLATGLPDQSVFHWRLLSVPHPRAVVALAVGALHPVPGRREVKRWTINGPMARAAAPRARWHGMMRPRSRPDGSRFSPSRLGS